MEGGLTVFQVAAGNNELTSSIVNRQFHETVGEFVAIVPPSLKVADELFAAAVRQFSHDHAAALLFLKSNPLLTLACGLLPASCLPFAFSPQGNSVVVISKSAWSQVGDTIDVSDPIREWLMRAVMAGKRLIGSSIEMTGDATNRLTEDLPDLGPGQPQQSDWLHSKLSELPLNAILPSIASEADATALQAGFLLMNDFLDASHTFSQSVEGAGRHVAGDYWHAIMHRREPDYSNSKYWFRRVGDHPLFGQLASFAGLALDNRSSTEANGWKLRLGVSGQWDPFAFVDMCQLCAKTADFELCEVAQEIQFAEMLLLLAATFHDAAGTSNEFFR